MIELLTKTIGGFEKLSKHKVIYTAIVHTNQPLNTELTNMKTNILLINQFTPKFPIDYQFFTFTKTYCDNLFITGNMAREAKTFNEIDIFNNNKEYQQLKGTNKYHKINYVATQSLNNQQIYESPFFIQPCFKNIIQKNDQLNLDQQMLAFIKQQNIHVTQTHPQFKDSLKEFMEMYPNNKIFVDIGPAKLEEVLSLIDLYIITIYSGDLDKQFILSEMPSFSKVLENFKLTYKSEQFPQHQGFIQFFVFEK